MIIRICFFTDKGKALAEKIASLMDNDIFEMRKAGESLSDFVGEAFKRRVPLICIGAAGIVVRAIAPYVKDKFTDIPVLVIDEKGQFVVPILSGHVGGANELAKEISKAIKATEVITTATDTEEAFSVDVFAVKNGLKIVNREGIKDVSSRILKGETIKIYIEDDILVMDAEVPKQIELISDTEKFTPDVWITTGHRKPSGRELVLKVKDYVLGVGCKRGKTSEELLDFVNSNITTEMRERLYAVASIDLKAKEPGLLGLCQYLGLKLYTYPAEELKNVQGDFSTSDFVESVTGVSNVCERASVLCAGYAGELIQKKVSHEGMTLAIAKRRPSINTFKTIRE